MHSEPQITVKRNCALQWLPLQKTTQVIYFPLKSLCITCAKTTLKAMQSQSQKLFWMPLPVLHHSEGFRADLCRCTWLQNHPPSLHKNALVFQRIPYTYFFPQYGAALITLYVNNTPATQVLGSLLLFNCGSIHYAFLLT